MYRNFTLVQKEVFPPSTNSFLIETQNLSDFCSSTHFRQTLQCSVNLSCNIKASIFKSSRATVDNQSLYTLFTSDYWNSLSYSSSLLSHSPSDLLLPSTEPEVKPWQIDVPQAEKISKNPSRMHESCNITDVIDTDREPECSTSGST